MCQRNIDEFEMDNITLEQQDIKTLTPELVDRLKGSIDTVIMNPPFGTKHNEGNPTVRGIFAFG